MIDTKGFGFPKPSKLKKQRRPGIIIYSDGREVCDLETTAGRWEYGQRKHLMWMRQQKKCRICTKPLREEEMVFEHQDGKGLGGSHQDDRVEKDGKPYNSVTCGRCNILKGSKRGYGK